MIPTTRRQFLRSLGLSAAALPFLPALHRLRAAEVSPIQRIVFMFSPNGTILPDFWPDQVGEDFQLKRILAPLEPFKNRLMTLKGIANKISGDGDGHMRGMSCLLTGSELLPGNIRGGGGSPAGWAGSISIDQEIKNFLQSRPETRTRFGSLEFGVAVPDRADPWTRMSYAGPNQPVATKPGRGLANMRRRAERCGAALEVMSGPDGTSVRLDLPLVFPAVELG